MGRSRAWYPAVFWLPAVALCTSRFREASIQPLP